MRRKLQRYNHVSRSLGLAKTILQGTVKGGRRQGRQRKRWEDNIREWTRLSSASPRGQWRTGENGENWLQNHLWFPNHPRGQGIDYNDDDGALVLVYSDINFPSFDMIVGRMKMACKRIDT